MTEVVRHPATESARVLPAPAAGDGPTVLDVIGAVVRYRRLVVRTAVVFAALVAVFLLVRPRTYTATAAFTPQSTRPQMGALGGLAAQFGIALPMSESNQSPAFYAELLHSRTILEPLVQEQASFSVGGTSHSGSVLQLLEVKGKDSAQRVDAAVRKLRKSVDVSVSTKTGIVGIEVHTRYAPLSAILAERALDRLHQFNMGTRRSQAAAQRQFLERRQATVAQELRSAEEALREFTAQNRGSLQSAPHLVVQSERLSREVTLRSQVYSTLAQALEQAKLDEIRETPLITITEAPSIPARPDPRGLIISSLLALFAGLFLGSVAALLKYAVMENRKVRPQTFDELSAEIAAAKSELSRILRPIRRGAAANGRG